MTANCGDVSSGPYSSAPYDITFQYSTQDQIFVYYIEDDDRVYIPQNSLTYPWVFEHETRLNFTAGDPPFPIFITRRTTVNPLPATFQTGNAIRAVDLNDNFQTMADAVEETQSLVDCIDGTLDGVIDNININISVKQLANVAELNAEALTDPENLSAYDVVDSTGITGASPAVSGLPPQAGGDFGEDPVNGVYWDSGIVTRVNWDKPNQQWIFIFYFAGDGDNRWLQETLASPITPNPNDYKDGTLWFDSGDGNLYVLYNDGESRQWVITNPLSAYGEVATTDDIHWSRDQVNNTVFPRNATDTIQTNGGEIQLNADGTASFSDDVTGTRFDATVDTSNSVALASRLDDGTNKGGLTIRPTDDGQVLRTSNGDGPQNGLKFKVQQGNDVNFEMAPTGDASFVGDVQMASQNSGPLAGFRNHFINGDFRFWQRGDGPWTNPNNVKVYTADRWNKFANVNLNEHRKIDGPIGPFSGGVECTAGSGGLCQYIELAEAGFAGPYQPNTVWTLSIYSDQVLTSYTPQIEFRESSSSAQLPWTAEAFVSTEETISDSDGSTYTRYSSRVTAPTTALTTQTGLFVNINAQTAAALDTTVKYTGGQFEPGPVATPFEHRPYGTELALCQRYYQIVSFRDVIFNAASSAAEVGITAPSQVEMRTSITDFSPNVIYSSAGRYEGNTDNADEHSIVSASVGNGIASIRISRLGNSPGTALFRTVCGNNSAQSSFRFDAEL